MKALVDREWLAFDDPQLVAAALAAATDPVAVELMTRWEQEFVTGVHDRFVQSGLSWRQRSVLRRILRGVHGELEAREARATKLAAAKETR